MKCDRAAAGVSPFTVGHSQRGRQEGGGQTGGGFASDPLHTSR